MMTNRRALVLIAALAAAVPAARDASSGPPVRWNRSCADRAFVTVSVLRNTLEGDLDGKLALGNVEKVFYVPKLDPGLGLSVGYGQTRKNGLWMIVFTHSVHDAAFRGGKSTSSYNGIEFGGKGYLWTGGAVLPYVQIGFGLPWVHVPGAAERGGKIYAANYLGLSVNGGAGLLVPLGSRTFLTCGATYRYFAGMYAKGPGRGRDVTNLNIDRTGPRREIFLKVPGLRIEIGIGYLI
jgi:hypothetical protein